MNRELSPQSHETLSVAKVRVPPRATHGKASSTRSDKPYIRIEGTVIFELHGESVEVQPGVVLDFNAQNRVVGVEMLNISKRVGREKLLEFKFESNLK